MTGLNTKRTSSPQSQSPPNAFSPRWKVLRDQPNEVGRRLCAVNSTTIGVIVPNLYGRFFATCAHTISTVARQHGYSVLLTTSDENSDIEQKQIGQMLRDRVNGLVIVPVADNNRYYSGKAFSQVHVVTLDRPAPCSQFDSVLVPNRSGAKTAIQHLIGHGHRSIAFLGLSRKLYTMKACYAGYREAMSDAGHSPEPYIDCDSPDRAVVLIHSMMNSKKPPTALFAANNLTMRYVLHALSAASIHVPRQIAIAGFDDFEMADVIQPAPTVIRQPVYELGEVAANLLFQQIFGREAPKASRRVVLPLELVVRSSCGCQPRVAKGARKQNHSGD